MNQPVPYEPKEIDDEIRALLLDGRDQNAPWGRNTPSNLADELGVSRQWVSTRLQVMQGADVVANIGGGVYELQEYPERGASDADDVKDVKVMLDRALDDLPEDVPCRSTIEDARTILADALPNEDP